MPTLKQKKLKSEISYFKNLTVRQKKSNTHTLKQKMPICKKEIKERATKSKLRLIVEACKDGAKAKAAAKPAGGRAPHTEEELAAKAERKVAWELKKAATKARRRGEHHEH